MVKKAVAAGGAHAIDPQDHGFMYGWSFYDPGRAPLGGVLDGSVGAGDLQAGMGRWG